MGLLDKIKGLFATDCKESVSYTDKQNQNNNNSNQDTTMITKEEMMQIASMVASMLNSNNSNVTEPKAETAPVAEPIVTEPTAPIAEPTADEVDTIVEETIDNDVPTDQESVMGGDNPLVSNLDSIIANIQAKVEQPTTATNDNHATIVEYSDKGIAIYGDTKDKYRLAIIKGYQTTTKSGRTSGAIFRRQLTSVEGQPAGWIISKENIEAKGGLAVFKASLEATGMTITIGESVKDITNANHEAWEAKKKSESDDSIADAVPEAKAEAERIKAEIKAENKAKGKGKGKTDKPSIAPTDKQKNSKKNDKPKGETPIIPIVKPKEYKGYLHLANGVKDWTFTEESKYSRIVSYLSPKGDKGYALSCSTSVSLDGAHFICIGTADELDSQTDLMKMLDEEGLAQAIYKNVWTKPIKKQYAEAYIDGGSKAVGEWIAKKVA